MGAKLKLNRDGSVEYFAEGGEAVSQGFHETDPLGGVPGIGQFNQGVGSVFGSGIGGTGDMAKTIGKTFTVTNPYQATLAPTQTSDYGHVINQASGNALSGYGNFSNNLSNQNALANALVMQSQGQGPNPALAQLNQQTGNNIAAQGALMAGQRGVGANPGLLARQIAMNGANVQQNAVGQAATQQAQQQLAAQSQLQGLYGQIGNQITGQQAADTSLFNAGAGAQNAQNMGQIQNYGMQQGINSQVAQNNANAQNKTTSGLMNAAGSAMSMFALAKGGEIPNPKAANVPLANRLMPAHFKKMAQIYHPEALAGGGMAGGGGMFNFDPGNGGSIQPPQVMGGVMVPHLQGEVGQDLKMPGSGNKKESMGDGEEVGTFTGDLPSTASFAAQGGGVPGKAKVKGDNRKNDTVPAMLSPGEIVIPRSVLQSDDPVGNSAKFVEKLLSKHGGREEDDFKKALRIAMGGKKK